MSDELPAERSSGWKAAWRLRLTSWFDALRQRESRLVLLLSLVIGAVVGLVVVAFILLTGRLATQWYPQGGLSWRRLLVPVLGSAGTGYLLYRWFPMARGSGIPQTKVALFLENGRITFRTVAGKFFCCSASLASGIALGREGPSVQIGAGIASIIARRVRLSREQVQALLPVGTTAALAAAFNTPIAAVLFSLEEIMGDLHAPILGSVVLSAATSWMVMHLFLGDSPLFHVPAYSLGNPAELLAYAALGVAGGLGSVAFVKLLLALRRRFRSWPQASRWAQPAIGGLTVGLMGYFVPDVLGVGYGTVDQALAGGLVLNVLLLLAVLKLIATAVCYASGNAGGIFGPSLFIGAMIGGAVGHLAQLVMPSHTAGPGAYALVGMGAVFAGIIRTPFTSVIMIFELTRDYAIIVPVMIANMTAFFLSQRLQPEPIYEALARQDGIHLPTPAARQARTQRPVAQAMLVVEAVAPSVPVREVVVRARRLGISRMPLADAGGLRAMLAVSALEAAIADGLGDRPVGDLAGGPAAAPDAAPLPHLHPDHDLHVALERFAANGEPVLPVVSRADVRRLVGVVTAEAVWRAYGLGEARGALQREHGGGVRP